MNWRDDVIDIELFAIRFGIRELFVVKRKMFAKCVWLSLLCLS